MASKREQLINRDITNCSAGGRRPVSQYEIQGKFIQRFDSITDAAKTLNTNGSVSTRRTDIIKCCKNKKNKSAYGFVWKYDEYTNIENEIWKPVSSLIQKSNNYYISNMGRLKDPDNRISYGSKATNGYMTISITGKSYSSHKVVVITFLTNYKDGDIINHIDEDKTNNKLDNLELSTIKDNSIHSLKYSVEGRIYNSNDSWRHWVTQQQAADELKLDNSSIGKNIKGHVKRVGKYEFRRVLKKQKV